MILDTNLKLEAVLAGAITTSQPEYHVYFVDWNQNAETTPPAVSRGALNSTTDVTILSAPGALNPRREVQKLVIYNKDTLAVIVTVKTDDGTTERIERKTTLNAGDSLCWEKDVGWYITASPNAATVFSTIANSIGSDVALSNTSNYFDGPSVAQGTAGTWFVSGTVVLQDTAGGAAFLVKLWDGTTIIATGEIDTSSANQNTAIALSGVIAAPAGNLRISARDTSSTSGKMRFNAGGSATNSTITAIRIG